MDLQPILRPRSIAVVGASPRSFIGRVTRVGNTSRTVEFEARKVIASRYDISPSAADVLAEPTVTCRATGTTVILREYSRRPR